IELRDVAGASIVVACDTVADVAIAANEEAAATRPPGASATWFYHGSLRPLPKDVTTRSPILPPE
ncbi:MAG: hypothetical protein H0W83_15400, partial [Planctomycetes bacterium]|nr:hypothetical protein [Planctomycetota bacterium]